MSSYLTLSPLPRSGRFPFCGTFHIPGLETVAVSNHPALWSSDFPLLLNHRSSGHPACSGHPYCTPNLICVQSVERSACPDFPVNSEPGKAALCPEMIALHNGPRTTDAPSSRTEIPAGIWDSSGPRSRSGLLLRRTSDICRPHGHLPLDVLECRPRSTRSLFEKQTIINNRTVPRS